MRLRESLCCAVPSTVVYSDDDSSTRTTLMLERSHYQLLGAATALLLAGCQGLPIDNEWAGRSSKLEVAVDADGNLTEIEYHIAPNLVPAAVRAAMSELYPDAMFDRAEYEVGHEMPIYELVAEVDGMAVQAMFFEDGKLHLLEIEVDPESEPAILRAVMRGWPGCAVAGLEQVRDSQQLIVGYHVDIVVGERKLKVTVDREATITAVVREMTAEIEIPAELPR